MMKRQGAPADTGLVKNFGFFVCYMVLLSAFGSFVNDMYIPSLPSMCRFFGCSASTCQLGLTMGMIGLGVGQIVMGPVSERHGRKPVLLWSSLLFLLAAVVSVFSPTITFFLLCRLFQGLGASGGYFLARTIPADVYHGRPLARVMAIVGAINGFAPACAPVVGGVVADHFTWKGTFVVLALFAVIILCMLPTLKETLPPSKRRSGPISQVWANYRSLLVNGHFMAHVLLKGSALGMLFAYVSASPFIFQDIFGFSQTGFGLIMGVNAIALSIGAVLALKFRLLKKAAIAGAVPLVPVMAALCAVMWLTRNFWAFELLIVAMLFLLGMLFTVGNTLAMNEGREHAGLASALLGVTGYVFGATVAPLVGLGDIMHSTAITFMVLTLIVLGMAIWTNRLTPDSDMVLPSGDSQK